MPCLSGQYNPALGVLINVGVLPPGSATQTPTITTYAALVDTGASDTCIGAALAQTLGLQPIGMRAMASATHTTPMNVYQIDLVVVFGNQGFVLSNLQVMEFAQAPNSPFQVLIGRDVICRGALTLSFDGHFTFSL